MSEYGKALSDSGNNLERLIHVRQLLCKRPRKLHAIPRQAPARSRQLQRNSLRKLGRKSGSDTPSPRPPAAARIP